MTNTDAIQVDSAATERERLSHGRSKLTNRPGFVPREPLRPRQADRRRRDLVKTLVLGLGGPQAVGELALVQVKRCAELQVMCEAMRADMINGKPVDLLGLVRLENTAKRAQAALGLKVEALTPPRGLLRARARWQAQEQQENKAAAQAVRRGKPSAKRERPPDDEEEIAT